MPVNGEAGGNEDGGTGLREGPAAPFRTDEAAVVPLEARRRPVEQGLPAATGIPARPLLRILMIDGSEDDFNLVRELLACAEGASFRLDWASRGEAGLRRLAAGPYDACLVDAELPDQDGLEVVRIVERRGFKTPVILLGGNLEREPEPDLVEQGVADYLDKEELDTGRLERCLRFAIARKRASDRLDHLAQFDPLTGLANRALFDDRLDRALRAARRNRSCVAVAVADLNGFKAVNDSLGHAAGDELLRAVAVRLRGRVRESDTVARLGGDEFALVLENLQRPEDAVVVARKILDAVGPPIAIDGRPVTVTLSLGIALFPRDAEDGPTLLRHADAAMYEAKSGGGSLCRFHDTRLDGRTSRGALLEADMRRALEQRQLILHYQPQVTLCSSEVTLAAMVRWQHPQLGLLDADRFRMLAEDSGMVEPLTDWMLSAACAQAREWQRLEVRPFHLSVPILSRRQLGWSKLAERVEAQLQRHGLPRACLELEIEERLLLEEVEAGGAALRPLRELGMRLALDRFGAGTSALKVLREAPIHTLKLVRELIRGAPEDGPATLFLGAVIRLAKHLRLRVVAEGAETPEQLQLLRREGCDAVQSFGSVPPLPAAACADWLRKAASRPV
jgi:diguanylate cyclase (GGDEF)-like protein